MQAQIHSTWDHLICWYQDIYVGPTEKRRARGGSLAGIFAQWTFSLRTRESKGWFKRMPKVGVALLPAPLYGQLGSQQAPQFLWYSCSSLHFTLAYGNPSEGVCLANGIQGRVKKFPGSCVRTKLQRSPYIFWWSGTCYQQQYQENKVVMANNYSCILTTITSAVEMEFGGLQPPMLLLVSGSAEERGPRSNTALQGVSPPAASSVGIQSLQGLQ